MSENQIIDTALRGEIFGRVRDLAGFTRFHREPEACNARARRFVQAAGTPEIMERGERLFGAIRGGFHYKRKEIVLTCEEGGASIATPDFAVTLTLDQDPKVAANYQLVTQVDRFTRPEIVTAPSFLGVFAPYCDRVVINFAAPLDLEAKIDRIEKNDALAALLDYDSACSWFSLHSQQVIVEVTPLRMICKLPGEANLEELIVQTRSVLDRLVRAGAICLHIRSRDNQDSARGLDGQKNSRPE